MMTSGSRSDAFNQSHVSDNERRLNELKYRVRQVNLPQMECIDVIKQIKTEASNRDKLEHFTMNSRDEEDVDLRSHVGSGEESESEDREDDAEDGDETESEDEEGESRQEDEHEQEEEVRQEQEQTHVVEKTRRGPTHMRRFWKEHDVDNKINLKFNRFGQPCGLKTCKLTNFIGTLVKGKEMSLAAQNWSKVPKLEKEKLWDSVQAFFNIDESYKRWVLRSASKKWKDFKVVLKRKYYKADLSRARNILNGCDNRIPIGQWEWLVKHWRTEKAKEKSERNKATRASQLEGCNGTHTAGSRSFAVVLDQMEMVEGREIGRAELYVVTHTKNNGYPVNQQSRVKMERLEGTIKRGMEVSLTSPNSASVVAMGTIQKTDRKAKATDGQPLADCVEVLVNIVLKETTELPRAQGKINKLGNAQARCIPWPRKNIMQTGRTTVLHSKVSSVCSQMSFNNSENVDPNNTTTGTQVTNHQTGCSTSEGAVRNTLKRKKVSETTMMKKGTQAMSATTGNNILMNSGRET